MLVFDSEPRSADPALRVAPPVEPGIESVVEPAGAPGGEAVTSAEPGANKQADPLAPPADPRPDEQTDGRSVVPPELSAAARTDAQLWPGRGYRVAAVRQGERVVCAPSPAVSSSSGWARGPNSGLPGSFR